ncbi:extracellular solute-binding protein [Paenibacillus ginsengarvi]|nr:extracellular solute-binding protein [Paenibacillus ginsengarvi]
MRRRPTKEQFHRQLEQMVSTLRNEIIEGGFKPGDNLPSEKALVTRFGMSNNSIRAGLEQLVEEGWIEKVARVGNRVAATRPPVKLRLVCHQLAFRNLELARLLEGFHRKYPWISVQTVLQEGTASIDPAYGGFAGDVLMLENYQLQSLSENASFDLLEPLAEKPDLYPHISRLFTIRGHLLMQPLIFSPIMLCYNKDHFRENGMLEPDGSWTWDDLMTAAEKLSDGKGRYGFCFHVPSQNRWPVFLLQSGERFEWEGGQLRDLRGTKLLRSMEISKRIIHNRKAFPLFLSESHEDIDRMFLEGKVSMTLSSYMGMNGWRQSDIEFDISPVPTIEEMRTLVISLGIGIGRHSVHKEEALLFIDYLTSGDAQSVIRDRTFSLPSLGTAYMDASLASSSSGHRPSRYLMFREIMSSLRSHGDLNISYNSLRKLEKELKAYWADLLDEEELCERLGKQLTVIT